MSGTHAVKEGLSVSALSTIPPVRDLDFATYLERTRNEPIYVILGSQGSGTNFLGRLLKRFFGFSLLRDRSMVFNAAARLGRAPSRDAVEREIRAFLARAFPSAWHRKLRRVLGDYSAFPGIRNELRPEAIANGAAFARLIYAYRAYSLGTTRMAVKSDDIWETLPAIDSVLPNRRVILITRDFRDNLMSISGKTFGPIDPIRAAQYVKARIAPYIAEYHRAGPHAYHVKFETLVTAPHDFLRDFSRRYGLAPVIDIDAAAQAVRVRPNKMQKWKRLSAQQLAWCEGILQDELVEFGYAPESLAPAEPEPAAVLAATVRDTLWRIPQKVRHVANRLKR